MAKFAEAEARKFKGKFVCRKCKTVMKATSRKIIDKKVRCRKCAGRAFKPKRKK